MSLGVGGGPHERVGDDPTKTAQVGGSSAKVAPVGNRPVNERVWKALVDQELSERETVKRTGVKRWKVRELVSGWIGAGWLVRRKSGGVRPTDKAPKTLRKGWAATPMGRPLEPLPKARVGGTPARFHRAKLKAPVDRGLDFAALEHFESAKPSRGTLYFAYVLPCKTESGFVGVPVQVIQPKATVKPCTLVVQSANIMMRDLDIASLGYEGTLEYAREAMRQLLVSWLGEFAGALGELVWTGLDREQPEVAVQAGDAAPVKGDVQTDFVAVDKSDKFTPFTKEEEQTLSAFVRLHNVERRIEAMQEFQERLAELQDKELALQNDAYGRLVAVLEQAIPLSTNQFDAVAAALEARAGASA